MKIALIQVSLVWENPKSNRDYIEQKIATIEQGTDLIILPEMFATGFTMQPKAVAETMQGDTVLWMQYWAKHKNCAIIGSLAIVENDKYYNRLLFVFPSGAMQQYDKKHLFSLAGEDTSYTSGTQKLVVEYKNWRICPLICYDLRFPVFSRNVAQYDLLIYCANWPETRISAWDILLKARAVENICYVVGVNRLGEDGNALRYVGHSQVADFLGDYLIKPQKNEGVFYTQFNKEALDQTRQQLGFLNDADAFEMQE